MDRSHSFAVAENRTFPSLGDFRRGEREVTETALSALAAAWTTTMIATMLFLTVLALLHAWDPSTYVRVVLSLDLYG